MEPTDADLLLLGGGGAAVSVLHRLALAGRAGRLPPTRVVVVDPLDRLATTPDDRTWSFWERTAAGDDVLAFADRTWTSLRVAGPDRVVDVDLAPTHRYRTLRSSTYYAVVRDLVADPACGIELVHVAAPVDAVSQEGGVVHVGAGAAGLRAPWALTSARLPGETPPIAENRSVAALPGRRGGHRRLRPRSRPGRPDGPAGAAAPAWHRIRLPAADG